MKDDKREEFMDCLNDMWNAFSATVDVAKDPYYITKFIEAKDRAHGLLADLVQEQNGLCTVEEAECSECKECDLKDWSKDYNKAEGGKC